MSSGKIYRPWYRVMILVSTTLLLYACSTLPLTADQSKAAHPTGASTGTPTLKPSPPISSPSATLSPTHSLLPTETSIPTESPLAISIPSLGYDCSQVERLPGDSAETKRLAEALVAIHKEQFPTEYIAIEDLWAVERLGDYVLLQMRITDEAAGIYVLRQPAVPMSTPPGDSQYELLASHVWGGWSLPSRFYFPELFTSLLPDAPTELFYCMSLGHIFFDVPASQELDLRRPYDCSKVESISTDSPTGKAVTQALLEYWEPLIDPSALQLDQVYAIQQLGLYLAIQVRFRVDGRLEPPEVFIAKKAEPGYQFGLPYPVGGANPAEMLRYLYAQDTSIPPALLACLDRDGWLLKMSTSAP